MKGSGGSLTFGGTASTESAIRRAEAGSITPSDGDVGAKSSGVLGSLFGRRGLAESARRALHQASNPSLTPQ